MAPLPVGDSWGATSRACVSHRKAAHRAVVPWAGVVVGGPRSGAPVGLLGEAPIRGEWAAWGALGVQGGRATQVVKDLQGAPLPACAGRCQAWAAPLWALAPGAPAQGAQAPGCLEMTGDVWTAQMAGA